MAASIFNPSSQNGAPAKAVPAQPADTAPRANVEPNPRERSTLVVGRGITLQGTVANAERLVVEGTVDSKMIQAAELLVAKAGMFNGAVEVEVAEIAGTFDGSLTARGRLTIMASGMVTGTVRCRRLAVEEGGQLSGQVEMLADATRSAETPVRA